MNAVTFPPGVARKRLFAMKNYLQTDRRLPGIRILMSSSHFNEFLFLKDKQGSLVLQGAARAPGSGEEEMGLGDAFTSYGFSFKTFRISLVLSKRSLDLFHHLHTILFLITSTTLPVPCLPFDSLVLCIWSFNTPVSIAPSSSGSGTIVFGVLYKTGLGHSLEHVS